MKISRTLGARLAASLSSAALLLTLTACAGTVPMQPTADANNPRCADLVVRLPDTVADQPQRTTNAQATGAWGDPAAILLYCGGTPTGPTILPCVNLNGVDWIRDDSQAPLYRFEAYGREPAVEVIIDAEDEAFSGTTALMELNSAVQVIPQTSKCVSADDLDIQEG